MTGICRAVAQSSVVSHQKKNNSRETDDESTEILFKQGKTPIITIVLTYDSF